MNAWKTSRATFGFEIGTMCPAPRTWIIMMIMIITIFVSWSSNSPQGVWVLLLARTILHLLASHPSEVFVVVVKYWNKYDNDSHLDIEESTSKQIKFFFSFPLQTWYQPWWGWDTIKYDFDQSYTTTKMRFIFKNPSHGCIQLGQIRFYQGKKPASLGDSSVSAVIDSQTLMNLGYNVLHAFKAGSLIITDDECDLTEVFTKIRKAI